VTKDNSKGNIDSLISEASNLKAPRLSKDDLHLFNEGSHIRLYEKLGAHPTKQEDSVGTHFAVWAPNAERVAVIGDFNQWGETANKLSPQESSGIWAGFIEGVGPGTKYKYIINSRYEEYRVEKADPFAFASEEPPKTASVVWDLGYDWKDSEWMKTRSERNALGAPISIYEVHLGSWLRTQESNSRLLSYKEFAPRLVEHIKKMGFTHLELMPLTEHPFYGSWGYQTTGYFAPTSRYGSPQDLMVLIDTLHQNEIGVILDWVPSHFPSDEHGLVYFDGTHLYEHDDPRKGIHPDWNSCIFNYGRNEVRSFLLSSAMFWLDKYHIDGLRVDAVASMLYLDYSRKQGEWIPNQHGGNENLEAISFLRRFNQEVYKNYPDVQTIAEESTSWPMVSRPTYVGGLGFGMKWDMGWMHDTLHYISRDPIHRRHHHNELTFRTVYAYQENFVLPLSHDEVVHGKGSLIGKMPGDFWQGFANLRLLYAYMYAQSGKKLLFMGCEFGQRSEWNHDKGLEWFVDDMPGHAGIVQLLADLNRLYRFEPALYELDMLADGFEWVDANDSQNSIITFLRKSKQGSSVLVALNFTPVPRHSYRIGVPREGEWQEALNTDAQIYGGSGQGNFGKAATAPIPFHGYRFSLNLTLPPLGAVFFISPR